MDKDTITGLIGFFIMVIFFGLLALTEEKPDCRARIKEKKEKEKQNG